MIDKQHEIPLKDIEPPVPAGKKKINDLTAFLLILVGLGIFFMSPIPRYILSMIPKDVSMSVLSNIYRDVTLDDNPTRLKQPIKYAQSEPLPVLGRGTGICFSFASTLLEENKAMIDIERLEGAKRGEEIAEIIAVATDKTEYTLNNVTLSETEEQSIICQMFSQRDSLFPNAVQAVYIRPLRAFTPSKIVWATTMDIH